MEERERERERKEGRKERTRRGFDRDPMVFHHTPLIRRITLLDNDYHYSPMGLVFTVPAFLSTGFAPVSKFSTRLALDTDDHRFGGESGRR